MEEINASCTLMAERLGKSQVFQGLPEADLLEIAKFCSEEVYQDGQTIFVEGEPATKMLIVERGKLAVEKRIQLGRHSTPRNATIAYVNPDEAAGFSSITSPHHHTGTVVAVEPTRVCSIDGAKLAKYLDDHPEVGLVVISAITRLVRGRYQSATNTLTYFLSIVSHELRTPLAAVENYLQTILGGFAGELNDKQKRMLNRCIIRVTDLSGLISDVVDLARMRPEQIQSDFEWFDPGEVGRESIEDTRLAATEKDIQIKVTPPSEFKPIVGSRRRMRQVFTNLLNNAIKFSPEGSSVLFKAWYDKDQLVFLVEDSGPGIPPADLPYIFTDFFRASNVGDVPGAGLGLSIAKKIMDAHQGDIVVENLKDESGAIKGSRFSVYIPLDLSTPEMRRREWMP
ncbi:MAG: ATP-binding protein [Anaerolineales bacterium]|jgi:signal transduction histidine kinase